MSDDLEKKVPQDASKVNVNQPYEVAYWCKRFSCTEAQLKAAVSKVGVDVSDVEAEIRRMKNRSMGM